MSIFQRFDYIFYPNRTCTYWWCGKPGVVLAYDSFSPECAHWFCESCWQEEEQSDIPFLDIVEDRRKEESKP
jgi:hypothetical protein